MSSIFSGGSIIAAVVAGAIALFAPCCISVMLPAYFASAFPNRRILVAMTFLFAAGIATIILPLAMGANVLQGLLVGGHAPIYVIGGLLMVGLAVYTLLGGAMHLPMPGRRAGGKAGPMSVYTLGVFSGAASSCCAPVLAGVIALSGLASSFVLALGLGSAYVFGMVAPLFVIALLWERFDWRSSRLFRPRSFRWRLGRLQRTVTATNLASGVLLAVMGLATLWIGLTGRGMPSPTGWQETATVKLQHYGHVTTAALAWIPGWAGAVLFLLIVVLLARRAFREAGLSSAGRDHERSADVIDRGTEPEHLESKEKTVEHPLA